MKDSKSLKFNKKLIHMYQMMNIRNHVGMSFLIRYYSRFAKIQSRELLKFFSAISQQQKEFIKLSQQP